MTTKLNGINTYFLPFNKGNSGGKGNPVGTGTYRTSYLWEDVLQKDSLLDIVQRFIHLQEDKKNPKKAVMIFPRYHQLDVVRKLIADVYENGTGHNYLIQHSAGSGKSNSISWLAHHLSNLHDKNDKVVFNSIIVITDRLVLDKQLQDTIYQFEHVEGVVVKIDNNAAQLADALNTGKKIIITTLQKFPFILEKVDDLSGKRFAIIVDEAHSSQTGEASKKMKAILGNTEGLTEEEHLQKVADEEAKEERKQSDSEDEIAKEMATHGRLDNLSFFAFTATPKAKTLEMFGTPDANGIPHAFHVYSMKQAIQEGFILDVLKNYVTYDTYFKIGKTIADDPRYEKSKANKALGKFLSLHPHNLAQKTQIIVEHFRTVTKNKIGGKAKAMVVTGSRLHAVRYYQEFQRYIKKMGYENELGILIAFSGTVRDGDEEYTEVSLNGIKESELPEKFHGGEYQVLLVAEKYQTGFDEPLLHTMFVDKKLSGVKAVQTLSRLNRTCVGKDDTFVLDFVNSDEDIRAAFSPYYEETTIEETTDANVVYEMKTKLDEYRVYWTSEIESFAKAFFKPSKKQGNMDFGVLNSFLDPAVDRYKGLEENEQEEFKSTLTKFVRTYTFLDFVIQTHHQYESERNAFWGFVLDHFRMMKDEIRADVDNIPMHELHRIVKDLYGELNKFVFSSNVYSVSREFEMCSNYLERMYWKFDSCCYEINDEYEDRDEYYKKLYDALLLKKEEKEATSKRFFDGFFVQKSAAKMADVELSFEQYKLPENMVDYGVVGNISDEFVVPGNIRKTTTFIPDLRFLELRNQNNCSALYCCLCLLLRRVKVSMDVVHKKTVFERILAFTKTEKYKIWEKRITGAMMVGVSVHIAVVYLLFAIGSSHKEEKCLTPFVYVSFALSTLILAISVIKKWKGYVKENQGYCLIVAIFLSFVYAALRLKYWPGMWQYEDLGTALVILASYLVMVFEKDKTE